MILEIPIDPRETRLDCGELLQAVHFRPFSSRYC
jgi:hypothetical protein